MTRTYRSTPPDPGLYRAFFFAPLILIEITSLSLLSLSPMARLGRSGPVPVTLNVISKILALVTTLTLFLPQRQTRHANRLRGS